LQALCSAAGNGGLHGQARRGIRGDPAVYLDLVHENKVEGRWRLGGQRDVSSAGSVERQPDLDAGPIVPRRLGRRRNVLRRGNVGLVVEADEDADADFNHAGPATAAGVEYQFFERRLLAEIELDERRRAVEIAVEVAQKHNGKVINYYSDIARAGQRPLLVYYIPALTGHRLTVEEMVALLDIDGVVGFKISDWDLFFMTRVLRRHPGAIVFNGNDEFLLPGLLYGATGGIGMNYNLFPRLFLGIYEAVNRNELDRALELQNLFLAYADVFFKYGGIRPNFEALMRDRGLAPYVWRRPRPERDEETNRAFLAEVRPRLEDIENALRDESFVKG
jgi:hypothetical protein